MQGSATTFRLLFKHAAGEGADAEGRTGQQFPVEVFEFGPGYIDVAVPDRDPPHHDVVLGDLCILPLGPFVALHLVLGISFY